MVICELFAVLLEWHRGVLGDPAGRPLEDRRVKAVRADIAAFLGVRDAQDAKGDRERFDAILLDVDNGPEAFTLLSNGRLYGAEGIARLRESLTAGGVLAVWSSSPPDSKFLDRLRRAGFEARAHKVRPREGAANRNHTIFLARRLDAKRRPA